MPSGKGRAVLSQAELDLLTDAWAIWVDEEVAQSRRLSRLRLYLHFLLARYAGMRPGEIAAFDPASLDLATGLLKTGGRRLFLPAGCLRQLRRILALAEAAEPGFMQIDSGFLRRTFYALADRAGLPPPLCAPRALRYARALELVAMHMPLELVAQTLGFKSPLQLAAMLPRHAAGQDERLNQNCLPCLIASLETSGRSARLLCEVTRQISLYCICSLEDLLAIEPKAGSAALLHIPPGAILPAALLPHCPNRLDCRLVAITADQFEWRLRLALAANLSLTAVYDRSGPDFTDLESGANFTVHIPPHVIQLRQF